MEGIVVINKEPGMTSHDVVAMVRKRFQMKRVGHAGTLDPLATGVLIILVGKATKLSEKFMGFDKAYRSTMLLGTATDSADIQGKILKELPYDQVTGQQVKDALVKYEGDIDQLPPMVSAVRHQGKKLYELARQGIIVERKPRRIRIHKLEVEQFDLPRVQFYMECSKGTYVRQVADDVGKDLGCGACICQLERTQVGPFTLDQAVKIKELNESHIQNWTD